MGIIEYLANILFGSGRNVVRETAEVFRPNAERSDTRAHDLQSRAIVQFGAEFHSQQRGIFDRVMDGINRLPRPALALGTLGLFIMAMRDPLWFAERMQGIALVPEPLWWLLGVIVSFYFGARHQTKNQEFEREIARTIERAPQVMDNIHAMRRLRTETSAPANTQNDAALTLNALDTDENTALTEWQAIRCQQNSGVTS